MTDSSLSRRGALKVIAMVGAMGAVAGSAAADSANKIAEKAAGYQAEPSDGKKCADCAHFNAPASCALVEGTISPNGWCRLYRAKAG